MKESILWAREGVQFCESRYGYISLSEGKEEALWKWWFLLHWFSAAQSPDVSTDAHTEKGQLLLVV